MEFPERLAKLRIAQGFTKQQLANRAGISQAAVVFYEQGRRYPKHDSLEKLAGTLGVSINYLIRGEDITPHQELQILFENATPIQQTRILEYARLITTIQPEEEIK